MSNHPFSFISAIINLSVQTLLLLSLRQVEIDALTPAMAASFPESHAEICCFDSGPAW
jgi:hypothetical protein